MKLLQLSIASLVLSLPLHAQEDPFKDYDPTCATLFNDREMSMLYYNNFLKGYGIKDGETVADIGAARGWKSILHVILKNMKNDFYIEDIDTTCLNQKNFNKVVKWYSPQCADPIEDTFHFIVGDEKSTRLPKNKFDRAILDLTYHELTYKKEILADISSILKKEGTLVIAENMAKKHGKVRKDCGHEMPVEVDPLNELAGYGLKLKNKAENENQKALVYYEFVKD